MFVPSSGRFLGVFVNSVFAEIEGVEHVLDNLQAVGATAIATVPVVMRPSTEGTRFPDLHWDGHQRVLSRPLWGGEFECRVQAFSAHVPHAVRFQGSPYEPLPTLLDGRDAGTNPVKDLIEAAQARGMETHLMLHPFGPRGANDRDLPKLIDGSAPRPPTVNRQTCLNNPSGQRYAEALILDTLDSYPIVDGLFLDWAEFGAYRIEDNFSCFCAHCAQRADELGYDWEAIERDVGALWRRLHHLSSAHIGLARAMLRNPSRLLAALIRYPGLESFLRFKARTVVDFYRGVRGLLDSEGHRSVNLSARGWPPPWSHSSGMRYSGLAEVCEAVTPKLFLFDYSAMPRWYGETIQAWNPGLGETEILDSVVEWMQLPDDRAPRTFGDYRIPPPDEDHPAAPSIYGERINEVAAQVGGGAKVYPFAHAYMPDRQWEEMIDVVRRSEADGMWVQMYGYLSNDKLAILSNQYG
ncbi:MAG: hypothetical protein WD942_04735 [Dehalococcoidia bacterium]